MWQQVALETPDNERHVNTPGEGWQLGRRGTETRTESGVFQVRNRNREPENHLGKPVHMADVAALVTQKNARI